MDIDSASVQVVEFSSRNLHIAIVCKSIFFFFLISLILIFCFCFLIDILPSSQFLGDLLLGHHWKNLRKFSSRLVNILLNLQLF
jgi:hypothetical protein